MPYKSEAQRKYFNANRGKLEAQGVDVAEWNQASKGKKMPAKVGDKDAEKVAFVRSLISYFSKGKATPNLTLKSKPIPDKDEEQALPVNHKKIPNKTQITTDPQTRLKKAFALLVHAVPEIGGAVVGGLAGSAITPEVTLNNNPIINRIRGDTFPRENQRIQNTIRGAIAGGVGVLGARGGYAAGNAVVANALSKAILARFPVLGSTFERVVPQFGAVAGGAAGGAGGVLSYDFFKKLVDKEQAKRASARPGKSTHKAFFDLVKAAYDWQQLKLATRVAR